MALAPRFEGTLGRTVDESEPWFDDPPHPGESKPNVVVVLLDDTGFAQMGCFGSTIDTPNIDRLAADGLQFTNFHVTPLCSPTRASLLTGRAPHAVGMRSVANFRTGFPNQLGHISNHAATVAEVLHDEGYATFAVGKWHLAPMEQCSAAGPFDQWPLARGFDRFYGFLEGETDQFHPDLVVDNHVIDPPAGPDEGYHVSEDLVEQALQMIADSKGVRPDRPVFAYVAFGATHAPHQAPPEYLDKYRGSFDEGWDVIRQRWYHRQLELGVIPPGTQLSPRNPGVKPWARLTENEQRLSARLQEAFAAFLDHTDDQIGRLVDGLERLGQLDNTVLLVLADNGASAEGGPIGVMHEMKYFNGLPEDADEAVERIDDIGGPRSHTNYPWGWSQAGNSPFKWYKQFTHEGGVHVPMIAHWPAGLDDQQRGTKRDQFTFVADITPTIYDILGIVPPAERLGREQLPVTGHSFAHLFADANAPAVNNAQYFENAGSRAIVVGEWKAVTHHQKGDDYDTEPWELYHLAADRSECVDLAEAEPERLAELVAAWWVEADKHGVLPIDDRGVELFGARFRDRSPHPANRRYVYRPPMSPMAAQSTAQVGGRSFDLSATIDLHQGDQGVLFATGSENSGFSIFIQNGTLVFDYNAFGEHTIVQSERPLAMGRRIVGVKLRRGDGRSGSIELVVDGVPAGRSDVGLYMRMISSVGASLGEDRGSAVSERYAAPFAFTGDLHEVVIQLSPERFPDLDEVAARAAMSQQ